MSPQLKCNLSGIILSWHFYPRQLTGSPISSQGRQHVASSCQDAGATKNREGFISAALNSQQTMNNEWKSTLRHSAALFISKPLICWMLVILVLQNSLCCSALSLSSLFFERERESFFFSLAVVHWRVVLRKMFWFKTTEFFFNLQHMRWTASFQRDRRVYVWRFFCFVLFCFLYCVITGRRVECLNETQTFTQSCFCSLTSRDWDQCGR